MTSGKAGGLKTCEPLKAVGNQAPPKGGDYLKMLSCAGQDTKVMAQKCGVTRATIYNWFKDDAFLAEKARALAEFRVDLSDIPLTHRRDRIEVIVGIANDE